MRFGLAFLAGATGGAVMTAAMFLARTVDMTEMNMAMGLGAIFTGEVSSTTWWLGFVMHLVISGLIALIYAAVFEAIHRSTWWLGLIGGAIHAAIGGFFMLLMPTLNPLIPETIPAPGAFAINYGTVTAAAFVMLHLVYGAIVGGIYKPVHTRAHRQMEPIPEEHTAGVGGEHHPH